MVKLARRPILACPSLHVKWAINYSLRIPIPHQKLLLQHILLLDQFDTKLMLLNTMDKMHVAEYITCKAQAQGSICFMSSSLYNQSSAGNHSQLPTQHMIEAEV